MFTLAIVFVLITGNQVGFLTNQFVWGKLICQNNNTTFISEADRMKTYHQFTLPEGEWECMISVYGDGILFPSWKDIISRTIQIPSGD